jgi:hypothetical protein
MKPALSLMIAAFAALLIVAIIVSGCKGYQPPGDGVWLSVPRK